MPFLDRSRDYWDVCNHVFVFSFQNLLDFSERKQTNLFSVLLDCSIPEQKCLRTIVFDHPRLICSNLICRRRAPMRSRSQTDPCTRVCSWTQMLDPVTEPIMYSDFIHVSNMQKCSVYQGPTLVFWTQVENDKLRLSSWLVTLASDLSLNHLTGDSLSSQLEKRPPKNQMRKLSEVNPSHATHQPQPITLNSSPTTHHPQLINLNPSPSTHHPQPITLNPSPLTHHPQPITLSPSPSSHHPQPIASPSTHHPQPITLNPSHWTHHPQVIRVWSFVPGMLHELRARLYWFFSPMSIGR